MYQKHHKNLECIPEINDCLVKGDYLKARKLLKKNYKVNSYILNQCYGLLENIENNFYRSKEYYNNCLVFRGKELSTLLSLARVHMELGDYSIAKEILTNLQRKESYYYSATIDLIYIYILVHDYEQAYYGYQTINFENVSARIYKHGQIIKTYLLKALGKNDMLSKIDCANNYTATRIVNNSDEELIKHIKKHINLENEYSDDKFFSNIDANKLLKVVKKEIATLNPNHFEISDMYRFSLDEPIGYRDKELTNDIVVVTVLDTKCIITMYPIKLSNEFDIDNNAKNEKLKLKRQNKLF